MEDDNNTGGSKKYKKMDVPLIGLKKKENAFISCAEIFYYTGNENSCFSCFILLRLDSHNDDSPQLRILWSHPISPSQILIQYPNLGKFVFVDRPTIYNARDLTYTFVLTNGNGVRTYGHVTAFTNSEAVVVLSPYPWCNFFFRLASLYRANGEDGKTVVRMLYDCATPPSGAPFLVPLEVGVTFTRPYDRLCSFVDTAPARILEMFDICSLLGVLADLLLEKHIIVVGPTFSIVSWTIMSLLALVAPFDWMHILIPILPSSLISVLAAPPPYLIGLLTSQMPLLKDVPIESAVFVYLDSNGKCTQIEHFNESHDYLPHSGSFTALGVGLRILKWRVPMEHTDRDLCSLFLTYYATLFGNIVMKDERVYLSEEHSASSVQFFQRLVSTQSFAVLSGEVGKAINTTNLDWLDNEFIVATVRSHPHLFPSHYDILIREEEQGGGYIERYNECFGSSEDFTSWTAAVHGFGGQNIGVVRLLCHCVCGHFGWIMEEDNDERLRSARFRQHTDTSAVQRLQLERPEGWSSFPIVYSSSMSSPRTPT